ncbi:MAG: carbohydrate ABC transporter permease [Spirochaetaceae bacterium]|nr:carbohydrate ABC transporter permease [Spirochaetaceae bacterium]
MTVNRGPIWAKIIIYAIMIAFAVMAIFPLLWMLLQSFKTTQDYQLLPKLDLPRFVRDPSITGAKNLPMGGYLGKSGWFYGNYPYAWKIGQLGTLFINSVIYTFITVAVTIVLGCMAGFAFAKIPNKATPVLHGIFVVGILLVIQSIMVPLYMMVNAVGLYNTHLGVLIVYIGMGLPMCVYLATDFAKSIPISLIESARIDGAKYLRIFSSIILPMLAPVAVTMGIMTFSGTWNEFMMINMLTSSTATRSLPVGINAFAGQLATDYGKQFSALVIATIPILLFYLIFRKQITKGVAAGAVKG